LRELGSCAVEIPNDRDERRCTDLVEPPLDRLTVGARHLDDLDTTRRDGRARDLPAQRRVG
jgi:hypothetical protein